MQQVYSLLPTILAGIERPVILELGAHLGQDTANLRRLFPGAHGVIRHLFNAGAAIIVSNRTMGKAEQLAAKFEGNGTVFAKSYEALAGQQFDIVINATSSSLSDSMPPLPEGLFKPGALAYDMMYGKQTPFLRFAREQGASQLADGLGMLVEQAAAAFEKWRGVHPDTTPVIARLRS